MEETQDNIANYYMLTLLKLNKSSFGLDNFINAYVTKEKEIVVRVCKVKDVPIDYWLLPEYKYDFEEEGGTVAIVYNLPLQFVEDFNVFVEGKFSHFSEEAKQLIIKHSGLNYKVRTNPADKNDHRTKTNGRLLALSKDPDLKEKLEVELAVKISPEAELWDIPNEKNFYKYM